MFIPIIQFSRLFISDSLSPINRRTRGLPVHYQLPESTQTMSSKSVMPSNYLILCCPLLFLSTIFPSIRVFSNESALHINGQSMGVSALTSVLPMNTRDDLLQNGLVGSPCSPRDSQESSPTPQFKSINSSAFSFLQSPTLTSIHDYWKNHSLDQTDLCWQTNLSASEYAIEVGS